MADDEHSEEDDRPDPEDPESGEEEPPESGEEIEVTAPGDWERRPADEEDLRHDDGSEPLAEPRDDGDDDFAEQEAGDVRSGADDDFDRPDPPDEAELEDTGGALEKHGEPLLEGPSVNTPIGEVPTRSMAGMAVFVLVFCIAFFALWALLDDIGILLGIIVGAALGLGAMKLLADRAR